MRILQILQNFYCFENQTNFVITPKVFITLFESLETIKLGGRLTDTH